jgi:hypothetical protein
MKNLAGRLHGCFAPPRLAEVQNEDTLDNLVVDHLSRRLFTAERLTEILAAAFARRAQKAGEIDHRVATLKREVSDASDKLKRLYRMVEDGVAEVDDILRDRIERLKLDR